MKYPIICAVMLFSISWLQSCKQEPFIQYQEYKIENGLSTPVTFYYQSNPLFYFNSIDSFKVLDTFTPKETKTVGSRKIDYTYTMTFEEEPYNYYLDKYNMGTVFAVTAQGDTIKPSASATATNNHNTNANSLSNILYWTKEYKESEEKIVYTLKLY